MTKREQNILNRIEELIFNGELSPEFLVKNIELAGKYLNLQTISDYAKEKNLSYNGVKKCRNIINLINHKFVFDND